MSNDTPEPQGQFNPGVLIITGVGLVVAIVLGVLFS